MEKKLTSYNLLKELAYSTGKKLLGIDWEKVVYWTLFALANTLKYDHSWPGLEYINKCYLFKS